MAETKTQTTETPENPRQKIREARERRRLRLIEGTVPQTIKVYAANETMREVLRHPGGGSFPDSLGEGTEWPNDSFTQRRLAEGSIGTEASSGGESSEPDQSQNPREQAKAAWPKTAAKSKSESNGSPKQQPKNSPPQATS